MTQAGFPAGMSSLTRFRETVLPISLTGKWALFAVLGENTGGVRCCPDCMAERGVSRQLSPREFPATGKNTGNLRDFDMKVPRFLQVADSTH
jgi:hypothetical protein